MRKLKLRLDDIRVTGFEVLPRAEEAGTVVGAEAITVRTDCGQFTCDHSCNISDCPELC